MLSELMQRRTLRAESHSNAGS